MAMPELTKQQKAALIVSRMARTVAHHEVARRIVTHDMSKCRAVLVDRAANAAVLSTASISKSSSPPKVTQVTALTSNRRSK